MEERRQRIEERLTKLDECVATLKRIVPHDYNAYSQLQTEHKWEVEKGAELVSQTELDIIIQLRKIIRKAAVGEESSLVSSLSNELGNHITEEVELRRQLRNSLIHEYALNYDKEVFKQASNLEDVEAFEKAVKKLLQ